MDEEFDENELRMLEVLVAEALYNGCYPPKARELLNLYDKIKFLQKKL